MNFTPKILSPSPWDGNPTFLWEENICHCEKIKIHLSPPKATSHRSLSVTGHRHQPQSTATTSRHHQPSSAASHCPLLSPPPPRPSLLPTGLLPPPLSRVFLKIYQIFSGIQFAYQTLLNIIPG